MRRKLWVFVHFGILSLINRIHGCWDLDTASRTMRMPYMCFCFCSKTTPNVTHQVKHKRIKYNQYSASSTNNTFPKLNAKKNTNKYKNDDLTMI